MHVVEFAIPEITFCIWCLADGRLHLGMYPDEHGVYSACYAEQPCPICKGTKRRNHTLRTGQAEEMLFAARRAYKGGH